MTAAAPQRLSVNPQSPHYDLDVARRVDKVFVDGVLVPNCGGYDKVAGWAYSVVNGVWQPKVHGVVKVVMKGAGG